MMWTNRIATIAVLLSVASIAEQLRAEGDASPIDFSRQILPVLSDKCFVCHGPDGTDKDILRLDSFSEATRDLGGQRAIDPATPAESGILARIHSEDDPMPPADAERQLTAVERKLLTRWVREGGQYASHWAFVPPRKASPSELEGGTASEIVDAFVENCLQQDGIRLAPEADRAVLARRVSLVLTGLPPEPDQLETFLADQSCGAYERFVDQLLTSPRYGEHQARYWLDAIRYGDTHGLHLDNRRGIYPYRNWVVYALNENLPLDQFITWQIAGDLLPNPTLAQRVATGFVRMNPSTAEGGVIPAEFQAKNNFDRIETLGTVLLGMSLTCARCHTHKYDPITHTEYYGLLAFFNSTSENPLDGNKYEYGPVLKAPADVTAWSTWNTLESERRQLLSDAARHLGESEGGDLEVQKQWETANEHDRLAMVTHPDGRFTTLPIHARAIALATRIAELDAGFTTTLVAGELPEPRTTRLLERGEYDLPTGDPIKASVPSVLGTLPAGVPSNRLGLARWLTSGDHPLVSRVLMNQVWQRVFGEGLVRTPEDFGLQGEQPTHPELLDWLAVELQDSGWDLKHMLRVLVTTQVFRQRSAWREGIDDPANRLLARGPHYRLDAEVIRDIGLWASGLLDPHMGGEGIKPYQPGGLWSALMHPASNTKKYERDKGQVLYRRSLYVYWKRTCPHPMLTLFDAPSREVSCVRRSRTNTPVQSLGLLNETQRMEMSRMLAQRLLVEKQDDSQRLDLLFTLLACRAPTDSERTACLHLLTTMRDRFRSAEKDALAVLSLGDAPRDETLDPADHAAWTQLAVTVLASDVAILLY